MKNQTNLFYNTTNQTGATLKASTGKAESLKQRIHKFFQRNGNTAFTPFEVMDTMKLGKVPVTSIRRAITNLTSDGNLIKTDIKRVGEYGADNFCWKLNN